MIIELYGLPGSGKTYFAEQISKKKGIKIITAKTRKELYFQVVLFSFLYPVLFLKLIIITVKNSDKNLSLLQHKIFFLLFNAIAKEQLANRCGDGIIDEGLVQFLISVHEKRIDSNKYQNILVSLKKILRKRNLWNVIANDKVRAERMDKRGRIPRRAFGVLYQKRWLAVLDYNFVQFNGHIKEYFPVKVIENSY